MESWVIASNHHTEAVNTLFNNEEEITNLQHLCVHRTQWKKVRFQVFEHFWDIQSVEV